MGNSESASKLSNGSASASHENSIGGNDQESLTSKILDYPKILGPSDHHNAHRHNKNGYWIGLDTGKLHRDFADPQFAAELPLFLKDENCTSVIDIGAGDGSYSKGISATSSIFVNCYDGNPDTQRVSDGACAVMDFSRSVHLPCQYDWVLSIKVGKHIPAESESIFFDNMNKLAKKGVIINWGGSPSMTPDSPRDTEYFNHRSDSYIVEQFSNLGCLRDTEAETRLRSKATNQTLRERLLVFRKDGRF